MSERKWPLSRKELDALVCAGNSVLAGEEGAGDCALVTFADLDSALNKIIAVHGAPPLTAEDAAILVSRISAPSSVGGRRFTAAFVKLQRIAENA